MRRLALILTVALSVLAAAGCGGGDGGRPRATTAPRADPPQVSATAARALGLTRALPAAYGRVCAEQAAYAPPGARACPPLVPHGRVKVIWAGPWSKVRRWRGGFIADFENDSLRLRRRGDPRLTILGHWRYDVSWTPLVRRFQVVRGVERPANAGEALACRRDRIGREPVEICRVVPWDRGGGVNGGHVAIVWRHGRVTYNISIHRYANERRARAMMTALIAAVLG